MPRLDFSNLPSRQFWGLLATFIGLFLMGGSSRTDVQSLAVLDPVMILCCGGAALTVRKESLLDKRWFIVAFGLLFLLIAFYIVPLPFEKSSQGFDSLSAIRAIADVPPTLGLMPATGLQSLFFLFAPLAVVLFAIQLTREEFFLTLPVIILAGTISGLIGLMQLMGSSDGPLYTYRITNNGSAVGLFANRNHAAVFLACLFPMLAIFASQSRSKDKGNKYPRRAIAIAIAFILVPLILVTGSRSGLLTASIGLIGGVVLYSTSSFKNDRSKLTPSAVSISSIVLLVGLVLTTIFFSRAEAINRFFVDPSMANVRADFWISSLKLLSQYFPFGFGPGSFVPAFQVEEPVYLLNGAYLNRLHNDWLETVLTFGIPGFLLILCGLVFYVRRCFLLWAYMNGTRSAVALGRMASIVIAILAVASMSDYPLRTPALMSVAALAVLWFVEARREVV